MCKTYQDIRVYLLNQIFEASDRDGVGGHFICMLHVCVCVCWAEERMCTGGLHVKGLSKFANFEQFSRALFF